MESSINCGHVVARKDFALCNNIWFIILSIVSEIIGGSRRGVPGRTQFFNFRIHFHQKAPASEVDAPITD